MYYCVSLDRGNLPHISNRPQQTPSLNGWEKSHITRCALVPAFRTSFLPKQSIIFCSSSSAQDSLQVSMTAADTVTGSAIKHTALGCVVRVSQGTKMLFSLLANSRKALAVTARLPGHVWPQGLQLSPRTQSRWSQEFSQSQITPREILSKSKSVSPQCRKLSHSFSHPSWPL